MSSFYDFAPLDISGNPFELSALKNKVVLIVNVASKCGLVPQYRELGELYERYRDEGLEILAFPCNQFGQQEPQSEEEILHFCQSRYNVTFPIFHKVEVNGSTAIPLYQWLKSEKPGTLGFKGIKWNFEKFLVDRKGRVVARYGSASTPLSFEPTIKQLLQETACLET